MEKYGIKALREIEKYIPLNQILIFTSYIFSVDRELTPEEKKRAKSKPIFPAKFINLFNEMKNNFERGNLNL